MSKIDHDTGASSSSPECPQALDVALREYLSSDTLNTDELAELMSMQQFRLGSEPHGDVAATSRSFESKRRRRWSLVAACCFVCMAALGSWRYVGYGLEGESNTVALIANELASNHIKLKPLDIEAAQFSTLQGFFTLVDFVPRASRFVIEQGMSNTLLGGRYCSIQGNSATQLRYRDAVGRASTVYQAVYHSDLYGDIPSLDRGELPLEVSVKGLDLYLWVEKGLLMVWVRPPPQ